GADRAVLERVVVGIAGLGQAQALSDQPFQVVRYREGGGAELELSARGPHHDQHVVRVAVVDVGILDPQVAQIVHASGIGRYEHLGGRRDCDRGGRHRQGRTPVEVVDPQLDVDLGVVGRLGAVDHHHVQVGGRIVGVDVVGGGGPDEGLQGGVELSFGAA